MVSMYSGYQECLLPIFMAIHPLVVSICKVCHIAIPRAGTACPNNVTCSALYQYQRATVPHYMSFIHSVEMDSSRMLCIHLTHISIIIMFSFMFNHLKLIILMLSLSIQHVKKTKKVKHWEERFTTLNCYILHLFKMFFLFFSKYVFSTMW